MDLEDWNNSATQEILLRKMKGFHPSLIAVCKKANDIKTWKLLSREPLPTWHRSRLVVIGGKSISFEKGVEKIVE